MIKLDMIFVFDSLYLPNLNLHYFQIQKTKFILGKKILLVIGLNFGEMYIFPESQFLKRYRILKSLKNELKWR